MKTLTIDLPDSLEMDDRELVMIVAARLYEQGKLSLGRLQSPKNRGTTRHNFNGNRNFWRFSKLTPGGERNFI